MIWLLEVLGLGELKNLRLEVFPKSVEFKLLGVSHSLETPTGKAECK